MTLLVIISHYFGELPHGITVTMFGWIAVDMFFFLSGFLIGRLILEKKHNDNFFVVFYIRRFCRIIPVYIVTVLCLWLLLAALTPVWKDANVQFPLWSYLVFAQGFFMVATQTIGAHWLAPTWTLAVEEHFYLVIPAIFVYAPRRWLVPILFCAVALALSLRTAIYFTGYSNEMAALVLLPSRGDVLALGLLAAVAINTNPAIVLSLMPVLRVAPIAMLLATWLTRAISPEVFGVFSPLLVGVGCAAFILSIVQGSPEATRFNSRKLQFLGNNGYCLYLIHLPILGVMHGLVLGSRPDLDTPGKCLVTLASLPICIVTGWAMTKFIEEPLTRYGRKWRWSDQSLTSKRSLNGSSELVGQA